MKFFLAAIICAAVVALIAAAFVASSLQDPEQKNARLGPNSTKAKTQQSPAKQITPLRP